jgi:hypothetical protein
MLATGPHPEPRQACPYPPALFSQLSIYFNTLHWKHILKSNLNSLYLSTKTIYAFLICPMRATLSGNSIHFNFIISKNTHYA